MSKKALRTAAVVVSLCFVLGVVPMLDGAEKRAVKPSILSFLKKPVLIAYALLVGYPPAVIIGDVPDEASNEIKGSTVSSGAIRTTGDDVSTPPIKKD